MLLASIALHLVAFNWASGRLGIPSLASPEPNVVAAALVHEQPAPPVAIESPPPARPKPKPRKKPAAPPAPVLPPPPPAPIVETVEPAPPGIEADGTSVDAIASTSDEIAPPEPATASAPPAAKEASPVRYKVDPPPSAELQYDVRALRDGKNWYGSGMFRWEAAGGSYSITGEASISILFKITVLNFKSEGALKDFGIAPVLYSEKPWRKSLTNTHFRHADGKISFSASEAVYPYVGGEQDRASIMWQLAAIGRGDAGQFAPGAEFDIVVAGVRDADTWRIRVIGQEEIETAYGKFATWHVLRTPREGSHDQSIDIWLAPQREWYPVKLRYTYANGDYLDMSLSGMANAVH